MNATTTNKPNTQPVVATLIRKVGIYRILMDNQGTLVRDHSGKFCVRGTIHQCMNFINCKRG